MVDYQLNKTQTQITETFLEEIPTEIKSNLIETIESIQFIKNLINPDREYAKDRPRQDGKIIVDVTNPHILEDMAYFQEPARHFQKFKRYTNLHPTSVPTSEYVKFWTEEARKCREGHIRDYDGEWITGDHYFYLNYSPILVSKKVEGKKRADRLRDFPWVYDGDYMYFHYVDQAYEVGKHGNILKKRGSGFSFKGAASLARVFVLGVSGAVKQEAKAFVLANEKEYLVKDGVLNKFVDAADWCATHTPWPRIRELKDSMNEMHWTMGYKESNTGINQGTKNEVIGVTLQGDPEKARGKRGVRIYWEESGKFRNLLKAWRIAKPSVESDDYAFGTMVAYGCLTKNNKVWNNQGELVDINNLDINKGILGYEKGVGISKETITYWKEPAYKECINIETNTGRTIECSVDHPILWSRQNYGIRPRIKGKRPFLKNIKFVKSNDIKLGDQIATIAEVDIWSNKKMWEPYLVGMLIGDGSYGFDKTPVLSNCDIEVNDYVYSNFDAIKESGYKTKDGRDYKETRIRGICPNLRGLGIYGQTKNKKTLPSNIHSYSKKDVCKLLSGLFDADGYYGKNKIVLTSGYNNLLLEVLLLLQKLGIHGNILEIDVSKSKNLINKNNYFRLEIGDKTSIENYGNLIQPLIKYKKAALIKLIKTYSNRKSQDSTSIYTRGLKFERVIKIKNIGLQKVYNLTANNTHTYISNGIVTKNTGGAEDADFKGAEELFYNPKAYNIYSIKNVYDKNVGIENICTFFFPEYLNRLDSFDENGNSDVIKALLATFKTRMEIKYGTTDPNALVQEMAEKPITPQEAMMRREGSIFPVADLKDYYAEIAPSIIKFLQPHYVGRLKINTTGLVNWNSSEEHPVIREYPIKDLRDITGAIEIFEMPKRATDGRVTRGRYIAGIDPIDYDITFGSHSLGSMFVFDLWTDRIVAEYTGRPQMATEFYETCLRLLKFYNAEGNYENNLKGLFAYFDNNRGMQYLCDTPEILRDMDLVKGSLFGNRAKGIHATKPINSWAKKLQADWLVNQAYSAFEDEEFDDDGNPIEKSTKMNLHTVRSIAYLQELIKWNPTDNYDRISAMGMVMILREERLKFEQARKADKVKSIMDDNWFTRVGGFGVKPKLKYQPGDQSSFLM